jgi:hypothetical protein
LDYPFPYLSVSGDTCGSVPVGDVRVGNYDPWIKYLHMLQKKLDRVTLAFMLVNIAFLFKTFGWNWISLLVLATSTGVFFSLSFIKKP